MRILHLLSQTELTGAEVYAQDLIQHQHQSGHSVFVISERLHVKIPVSWASLPLSTSKFFTRLANIRKLRQFVIENKIEVIHCHSRGAVRHAHWARIGLPVAQVTTLHGRQHFSWSKRLFNSYGEILIAICENVKKAMSLDFKMPESSIRVLRNPVQPVAESDCARKDFVHLAMIGRSSGPKGERFEKIGLHCFSKWLEISPQLRISVIAPFPERFSDPFRELLKNLDQKYPGQIQLQGSIPDLRSHLPIFDLVMASGRIAIESLQASRPVFAIGENTAHGLVRIENISEVLASNFGDIGAYETETPLDLTKIESEVTDFLQNSFLNPEEISDLKTKINSEFDSETINQEVIEIYKAAIFKKHHPHWIPVLMYHKVPDQDIQSRHRIFVNREKFNRHLKFFKSRYFQTLTFKDLHQFWNQERPYSEFPERPLLLTFDDGYVDNLKNAEPLLKQYGFRATIFLLGNHQITENTWDAETGEQPHKLMTLSEKKMLASDVWEIGSHGFDHLHLTKVSREKAFQEIQKSKESLENDFSKKIYCFAYPFGSTNSEIAQLAKKAGYSFAVNTDQGHLHIADHPHSIFRVNIFPEDGYFELWKKTSNWYRNYFFKKRGR